MPWEGTGTGDGTPAQVAQAQIAFLLDHAAVSQVCALTTAGQIRQALRDVPASDGNKLPPVLQTMSDVADVLDRLASAPIGPENPNREAELTAHIKALEDQVQTLTAQLEDAEKAREAAEALAKSDGFWSSYGKAAGTAAGAGTVALTTVAVPTALTYFLGAEHPLIHSFLTVMGRLPK